MGPLNKFFGRFETSDFITERDLIRQQLDPGHEVIITEEEVRRAFNRTNTRKSAGPDRLAGRILKECREELSFVYSYLFNISLDTCFPRAWKSSLILLVPKTSKPQILNDYRPVALTSIAVKSFEKIILDHVLSEVLYKLNLTHCNLHTPGGGA